MNRKSGLVLAFGAVLALSSCNKKLADFAADYFSTNPNPLELQGEKVPAVVTANIPAKFFVKNAEVAVTPYLVYDGTETAGPTFNYQGESVRGNAPVISYETGGTVTMPMSFDYTPAMAKSQLELAFTVTQGSNQYVLPRVTVASGVKSTAYFADVKTVTPAVAVDKFQKEITELYSADIMFLINMANIRDGQLTTEDMEALWAHINATKDNPSRVLEDINISAYASPDGSLAFNEALAERRELTTNDFVTGRLDKGSISVGDITKDFTAEDWEGFRRLVEASDLQDKELILSVLSNFEDPEEREVQLRNLASVYPVIADQILPQLRYARITAKIRAIGRSDEEILTLVQTSPDSLSVDEILYAASIAKGNDQKMAIYEVATKYYPQDYRTWNNLGTTQYVAGNLSAAQQAFSKAKSLAPANNADVNMNLGLIEMTRGNWSAANTILGTSTAANGIEGALGTYYLKTGDNAAAAKAFGDMVSNNSALAQILTNNYSKATSILNQIANPDATTYYLKAIVGARTNNESMVSTNLRQAIGLDNSLAALALNDLEFANFNIASLLGY